MGEVVEYEKLWDLDKTADFLSMSKSWLYAMCASNQFPAIYIGSRLRFDPKVVRAWLNGEHGGKVVRLPGLRAA
jgi:predicted DNA-binding transcriptional regulator AlpA